ncbi:hypothetical protein AMAG_11119 [Allomyces macrogynus ATCC 38327]|uniref:Ubiquitin-like domain-containing protein n=1 Tax=Allomyces macrogynus (strain ATCC 38327) TaxID=578462 RepID=A0A0L0ST02_ALLM3|nr:hypothetical protein AMAG_11119 [Allomyces macrogynus ATCC 38327]|eukprot:KNE65500.1 hypothetical protein AMAG_11119 [Allomyces macrogynus ATCC 38327]
MSQGEVAYVTQYLTHLAQLPLVYPDHHAPYKHCLRPKNTKKPLALDATPTSAAPIALTFKPMKSALAPVTLSDIAADTTLVGDLKITVLRALEIDPVTHSARFLLKGKVLADDKFLREYPAAVSGATVNVMVSDAVPGEGALKPEAAAAKEEGEGEKQEVEVEKVEEATKAVVTLADLAKDAKFWAEIRGVIDANVDRLGVEGGLTSASKVLVAFKAALEQAASK